VPRNDPTDTGGLFIGRRPGTAPVRYRTPPERGGAGRRLFDALLAAAVLVVEALVVLSAWSPQPVGWMWIGSQVDYVTGSVFLGIIVAFVGLIGSLILTLMLATRLDHVWRLLRRAGVLARAAVVVRHAAIGARGRAAAPTGKDAGPQECPWHFKGRGHSLSVIDVRHLGPIRRGTGH